MSNHIYSDLAVLFFAALTTFLANIFSNSSYCLRAFGCIVSRGPAISMTRPNASCIFSSVIKKTAKLSLLTLAQSRQSKIVDESDEIVHFHHEDLGNVLFAKSAIHALVLFF